MLLAVWLKHQKAWPNAKSKFIQPLGWLEQTWSAVLSWPPIQVRVCNCLETASTLKTDTIQVRPHALQPQNANCGLSAHKNASQIRSSGLQAAERYLWQALAATIIDGRIEYPTCCLVQTAVHHVGDHHICDRSRDLHSSKNAACWTALLRQRHWPLGHLMLADLNSCMACRPMLREQKSLPPHSYSTADLHAALSGGGKSGISHWHGPALQTVQDWQLTHAWGSPYLSVVGRPQRHGQGGLCNCCRAPAWEVCLACSKLTLSIVSKSLA